MTAPTNLRRPAPAAAVALLQLVAALNAVGVAAAAFHSGDLAFVRETLTTTKTCDSLPRPFSLSLVTYSPAGKIRSHLMLPEALLPEGIATNTAEGFNPIYDLPQLTLAMSPDAAYAFIKYGGNQTAKDEYPAASLVIASATKVEAVVTLEPPTPQCVTLGDGTQAEMAVGLPTGEGSNMAYHVHVLWLCADKGGKQTVLVPGSVPQVVFAASEFLATYSYSPAKKHISLVDHNVVYGLTTVDTFSSIFTVGRTLYGYSTPYGNTAAARFSVALLSYDAVTGKFKAPFTVKDGPKYGCGPAVIAGPTDVFASCLAAANAEVLRFTQHTTDTLSTGIGEKNMMGSFPATTSASDDVYIVTPVETGDYEDGPLTVEPLYLVKVLSKASNKEVRSFKVPFCTAGETGQPIMVP